MVFTVIFKSKYFQSIDRKILLDILNRTITCRDTQWLMQKIIESRTDDSHAVYFKGDDIFTPYQRHRGIPIGNLTSQFFANVYLNRFDHFAKQDLGCKYYIRYVDDFVVFDNSKTRLREVKAQFENYLSNLRLKLHEKKCRIFRVDEGVCFLGFRIFSTHRLLKNVPHRQWVFSIPKRLRIYFLFDRKLMGKLSKCAWKVIKNIF